MEAKRVIIKQDLYLKLVGKEVTKDLFFNPFLDEEGNICISEQEIEKLTNPDFEFLKDMIPREKDQLLKKFTSEKEWLIYLKEEAETEALRLDAELKKIDTIKPIK